MSYSNFLLFYARNGFLKPLRESAFRKFCRRNEGKKMSTKCQKGFKMNTIIGDSVDNQIAVKGIFEHGTSTLIEKLGGLVDTFLDVGCNIGYYSSLFGHCYPQKNLIAVDPNPHMINRTKQNLDDNGIKNALMLNCGIGSEKGSLKLNIPEKRHSLSSFAFDPERGGPSNTIEAEIKPLNDVIEEHKIESCLVKIDTEGFEYPVFQGLSEAHCDKLKYIIFELCSENMKQAGFSIEDLFKLPIMSQYKTYIVNESTAAIKAVSISEIVADKDFNANVLLVRNDPTCLSELASTKLSQT